MNRAYFNAGAHVLLQDRPYYFVHVNHFGRFFTVFCVHSAGEKLPLHFFVTSRRTSLTV